jgi:hypothetical protein
MFLAGSLFVACQGLTEGERSASFFVPKEIIDDVKSLRERPFPVSRSSAFQVLRGAVIYVRPEAGLTTERLQRIVDCHLAEAAAHGYQVSGMKECPLVLRGATASVRFDGDRFVVEIRASEGQAAAEVWRRALQMRFAAR